MKQGWESKTLGDVVTFKRGLTYSKNDEVDFSSKVVLRANNIDLKNNRLDFTELKYINDDIAIPEEKKVSKGSLIICTASGSKSHLGKVALIDDSYDYAFGGFMGQLKPGSNIDSRYLFYLLTSDGYRAFIDRLSDGVNINNLRFDDLSGFPILLPLLSEQKQIVKILDNLFEKTAKAKENTEKNLQNACELFKSYLQSVFANSGDRWEKKKLMEICEIRPPKNEARAKLEDTDTVSFVPMKDLGIKQKWLVPTKERTLKEVEGSYTYFADEDVLLAKITPCFENGKLGIARNLKNGIGFGSSEFIVFRTNKGLSQEFLYYYLLREEFRQEGSKRMMGAVGHKRVSKEFVENSIISVPSLLVQNRVVAKLDNLSAETKKLEAVYQQKLDDLEELKKSILQKAFNGKLVGAQS